MVKIKSSNKVVATMISYANIIVSLLTTFFFTPILLKYVGDDYGVFSFTTSIVSWLTLLSSTFSVAFVRFATIETVKTSNKDCSKTNTMFFALMTLLSLMSLTIGIILFFLFKNDILSLGSFTVDERKLFNVLLLISTINCSLEIIVSFFSLYIIFKKKIVIARIANLISAILYPLISALFLFKGGTMISVAIIMYATKLFANIVLAIYSFLKLKIKFEKVKIKENSIFLKQLLGYSSFILINTFIDTVNGSLDKVILGHYFGSNLVTIYSLGATFSLNLNSVSLALVNNYIPDIHELAASNKIPELNKLATKISTIQSVVVFLILGGFLSCGYPFVDLWLGHDTRSIFFVGSFLMIMHSFPIATNITIEIQRSLNKHGIRSFVYSLGLITNFTLTLIFIHLHVFEPLLSCLLGTAISEFIFKWIIISIYNHKKLNLNIPKISFNFILVGITSVIGIAFSQGIINILNLTNNLYIFLISGSLYVLIYGLGILVSSKLLEMKITK